MNFILSKKIAFIYLGVLMFLFSACSNKKIPIENRVYTGSNVVHIKRANDNNSYTTKGGQLITKMFESPFEIFIIDNGREFKVAELYESHTKTYKTDSDNITIKSVWLGTTGTITLTLNPSEDAYVETVMKQGFISNDVLIYMK